MPPAFGSKAESERGELWERRGEERKDWRLEKKWRSRGRRGRKERGEEGGEERKKGSGERCGMRPVGLYGVVHGVRGHEWVGMVNDGTGRDGMGLDGMGPESTG